MAFLARKVETLSIPRPAATWLFVGVGKGRKALRFGFRKPKVKFSWWKNRAHGRQGMGRGEKGSPEQTESFRN